MCCIIYFLIPKNAKFDALIYGLLHYDCCTATFAITGAIRIEYEVSTGSVSQTNNELVLASANTDFVAEKKTINMADGVSSAAINVTIMEDEIPEVDEVFVVRLLGVTLASGQASAEPPVLGRNLQLRQFLLVHKICLFFVIKCSSYCFQSKENLFYIIFIFFYIL